MTDLLHLMYHDLRRLARENERLREEVANAATAERARLAGLASEEDREMVQHYGYLATEAHRANCSGEACCEAPDRRDANKAEAEALALILARLAAARGEALEEDRLVEFQKLVSAHVSATRVAVYNMGCDFDAPDSGFHRSLSAMYQWARALLAAPTRGEGG